MAQRGVRQLVPAAWDVLACRELLASGAVDIRLLYVDGCPNWHETDLRLREAIAVAGLDVAPQYIEVDTPQDAERLSFRGSPTVLVDGGDPFADADAPFGLSCRVFRTTDGLRGAPTVAQLVEALR